MSKPELHLGYTEWNIIQQLTTLSLDELIEVIFACKNLIHYKEKIESQLLAMVAPKDVEPDFYNKEGF